MADGFPFVKTPPRPRFRLLEHPNSLRHKVPWFPRRQALVGIASIFLVTNLAIIIVLSAMSLYTMDKYTFWNFILITVLCAIVAAGGIVQGWLFTIALGIFLPLVFGSVILVVLLILIIIAIDETNYITNTAADPNAVNPKYSFREVRTGDWIMHGLPVAELVILLLFDLQMVYRAIIFHWERSDDWSRRWWIWVWNYVSPLILIIVYSIIFDSREKYTDKLSRAAGIGITIGLDLVVMTVFFVAVRLDQNDEWTLPMVYPDVLVAPVSHPHPHEPSPLFIRSTISGHTAPMPVMLE